MDCNKCKVNEWCFYEYRSNGVNPPCASNIKVATPSASNNSRYVAALEVYREWRNIEIKIGYEQSFTSWCEVRLNEQKDAHCT
jgi:hypothetical protein